MIHLDAKQIALYRERNLDVAELLAIDDHLSECENCRARLANGMDRESWSNLGNSDPGQSEHLTYEQIVSYIDGDASAAECAAIDNHVRQCARCAADCDDLREFSSQLRRRPRATRTMLYVAVGSIAAALIVSLLVVRSVNRKPEKAIVASLAVQVRDGNAIYGLDSRGQLVAPAGLDSTGRNLIHAALSGAPVRVDMPDALLGKRTIVLRGAVSDQSFRVLSPVAERVLSTQPEFHWEAVKGATAYKVEIFTSDYDPAVASPKISATAWTPDKALDRGQTYSWQVTAFRANGDLTAPQPPAPEARFEVLAPSPAQKIEAARRNSNHLLAAILETEQGLREDALADIAVLEKQNSGSAVVQRLRDALRDSQPPTSR